MTGSLFVSEAAEWCCLGLPKLWAPQGQPPPFRAGPQVPHTWTFPALNSSGGCTYLASFHYPEKGRM